MDDEITFVEAVKTGKAKITEIDNWVEKWHTGQFGGNKTLREYLGFSKELYGAWMRQGDDALIGSEEFKNET